MGSTPAGFGAVLPAIPAAGGDWVFASLIAQLGWQSGVIVILLALLFLGCTVRLTQSDCGTFHRYMTLFTGLAATFMSAWHIGANCCSAKLWLLLARYFAGCMELYLSRCNCRINAVWAILWRGDAAALDGISTEPGGNSIRSPVPCTYSRRCSCV
jgi:hypothetical protein